MVKDGFLEDWVGYTEDDESIYDLLYIIGSKNEIQEILTEYSLKVEAKDICEIGYIETERGLDGDILQVTYYIKKEILDKYNNEEYLESIIESWESVGTDKYNLAPLSTCLVSKKIVVL